MVSIIAPALLTGGIALVNSLLNRRQSKKNVERNYQMESQLAKEQFGYDMQQLNEMNKYNLPLNQVERLRSAGLNPALMYKGAPQNVQTKMAEYQRPEVDYSVDAMQLPDPLSEMSKYQDYAVKHAQVDNLKAQTASVKVDAALKAAQTASTLTKNEKDKFDLDLAKSLREYSADIVHSETDRKRIEVDNMLREQIWMDTKIRGQDIENELKKYDLYLRSKGILPGDKLYQRKMLEYIQKLKFPTKQEILEDRKNRGKSR